MEFNYAWGGDFQLRLLALLLREPDRAMDVIETEFFTDPMIADICKTIRAVYERHPEGGVEISKVVLKELVRDSLGRKGAEHWPTYRKVIRRLYEMKLKDKEIVFRQAEEFAKEHTYREALIKAERAISARKYSRVHEIIEDLKALDGAEAGESWEWRNLPKYDDFEFKNIVWLVEGLLPAESILALSGDEGVGKTMFSLSLSKSLTEGTDFLGKMTMQRHVLYLGLDVSQVTLQGYIEAMRWEPNGKFRFMAMWTGEGKQPPMLDDPAQMEKLYAIARETPGLVIIFDTLRDFFEGEENSSTDTKPVLDAVRKLRALGAAVILLTHPPKSGKAIIRGTGNISQKVDIPYLLEKHRWQGKDIVVLTCPIKNRFGSPHFQLAMRYLFIEPPAGLRVVLREINEWKRSDKLKENDPHSDVVQYVKEHPGRNQKQIGEALKMGDRSVRAALYEPKSKQLLKVGKGERKELRWYDADYEEDTVVEGVMKKVASLS